MGIEYKGVILLHYSMTFELELCQASSFKFQNYAKTLKLQKLDKQNEIYTRLYRKLCPKP